MNTFIKGAASSFKKFTTMFLNSYTCKIEKFEGRDVIIIEDTGFGGRSLTNNIEKVVADISWNKEIDPAKFIIVYRDSANMWDGWDHKSQGFLITAAKTWEQAVHAIIKFQKL